MFLSYPAATKSLVPGRVVLVSHGRRQHFSIGILLEIDSRSKTKTFSVLVLKSEEDEEVSALKGEEGCFFRYLGLASSGAARDLHSSILEHELLAVKAVGLMTITGKMVKGVDASKVLSDVRQREIPRFRDNPPGQSTAIALQELVRLSQVTEVELEVVSFARDFKIQDIDLLNSLRKMEATKEKIQVSNSSTYSKSCL